MYLQHPIPLMSSLKGTRNFVSRICTIVVAALLSTALLTMTAGAETPKSIDMKLLLISADGKEPTFAGMKSVLNQIGVPYDTLIASSSATLTAKTLSDGLGAGHYQGIILATGSLGYEKSPGVFSSAFTRAQWDLLAQYEATYKVRQASLYTYPSAVPDNYGLTVTGSADTSTVPLSTALTDAGKQVFPYLNAANPVVIKNAWTYLAKPISSTNPVPLLTTSAGDAIASIYTYADGHQNLTITTDGNPNLIHSLLLGYGVVKWVSKGFFLGERHTYLAAQPDDVFLENDMWDTVALSDATGLKYRMTGDDYNALINWQFNLQTSTPNAANIRLEMPFNGVGASGIYANDTLTPAVNLDPNNFWWISHTWDHEYLDTISYSNATTELSLNDDFAVNQIAFAFYKTDSMIQPNISGLNNPEFFRAAKDFGVKYVLSDTSALF